MLFGPDPTNWPKKVCHQVFGKRICSLLGWTCLCCTDVFVSVVGLLILVVGCILIPVFDDLVEDTVVEVSMGTLRVFLNIKEKRNN